MRFKISRSFLILSMIVAPFVGLVVAFVGVVVFPAGRGLSLYATGPPEIPRTLADNVVAALSFAFFLWTLFVIFFNCFCLIINKYSTINLGDKKFGVTYYLVAIAFYLLTVAFLLIKVFANKVS